MPDPHRQPGGQRRLRDQARAFHVHHHLHHQQVAPRFGEGIGHLPIVRRLLLAGREIGRVRATGSRKPRQRVRHRAGNRHRPVGCRPIPRLERDLDRTPVDGHRLVAEAGAFEHVPAGRERVGGDHVGARFEVGLVHAAHDVGMRPVRHRAPRGGVHLRAEARDLGSGCAVEHDDIAGGKLLVKNHGTASQLGSGLAGQAPVPVRASTSRWRARSADRHCSPPVPSNGHLALGSRPSRLDILAPASLAASMTSRSSNRAERPSSWMIAPSTTTVRTLRPSTE